MITFIFIAGLILLYIFYHRKKIMEKYKLTNLFSYHLYKYGVEYFLYFLAVISLYYVLYIFAFLFMEYGSVKFLAGVEEFLVDLKARLSVFNLNSWQVLLLLIGIFLLNLLRFPEWKGVKLVKTITKYKSGLDNFFMILVILCSVTFFGTQLGDPAADFELKIKEINKGYAELSRDTEQILCSEVTNELYSAVLNSFPENYRSAFSYPSQLCTEFEDMCAYYEKLKSEYDVKSVNVDKMINRFSDKRKRVERLPRVIKYFEPTDGTRILRAPPEISYSDVVSGKEAIKGYLYKIKARMISLLDYETGKTLACQLPKVINSEIKTTILKAWIAEFPILEPVIDAFQGAIDKSVQAKVKECAEMLTKKVCAHPDEMNTLISKNVKSITAGKYNALPERFLSNAQKAVDLQRGEYKTLTDARAAIDFKFNQSVAKWISQLYSSKEETRNQSVTRLIKCGDKINESNIKKLNSIMKYGSKQWKKFLYRQSHCTYYEYTNVKYYAAKILEKINNRYITEKISGGVEDARVAGQYTKRVTDPGWI